MDALSKEHEARESVLHIGATSGRNKWCNVKHSFVVSP